jgi:hypothetical protein
MNMIIGALTVLILLTTLHQSIFIEVPRYNMLLQNLMASIEHKILWLGFRMIDDKALSIRQGK